MTIKMDETYPPQDQAVEQIITKDNSSSIWNINTNSLLGTQK